LNCTPSVPETLNQRKSQPCSGRPLALLRHKLGVCNWHLAAVCDVPMPHNNNRTGESRNDLQHAKREQGRCCSVRRD
jgi:hypothetical protein